MSGNYFELRDWLESFIPQVYTRKELGLERIKYLLKLLGNPHYKFKSIHVAGTSGKGSTCWYIAKLLQNANFQGATLKQVQGSTLKIGLHISPHLVDIRERMQILATTLPFSRKRESRFPIPSITLRASESGMTGDGSTLMPLNRFLGLFNEIRPIVEKIQKEKSELVPSYFEILVAASFKYFAQEKVDWAVVEVGLGGRFDATNVLLPEVSVITNVGLDHTEILGKTIEKIAFEKAGIIKRGVPVVTGYPSTLLRPVRYTQGKQAQDRSGSSISHKSSKSSSGRALQVIARVARKQQAPLIKVDTQDQLKVNKLLAIEAVNTALSLRAERSNLSDSIASLQNDSERLFRRFTPRNDKKWLEMIGEGLPCRMEEIEPGVILDGAHNPQKIKFLINFLRKSESILRAKREVTAKNILVSRVSSRGARTVTGVTLVLAFKKGKDWKKMVDLLVENLPVKKVYATQFYATTDMGRFAAVEPAEIANYVSKVYSLPSTIYSNSQEAVFEAINASVIASGAKQSKLKIAASFDELRTRNDKRVILVTGSLYLVGEVRTIWQLPIF